MPSIAPGHRQLNLTFPADLIDAARAACDARNVSLTWELERALHRLAGLPVPKTPRKRGPKKSEKNSKNT